MNERLYYEDAYRTNFVAQVAERLTFEGQPAVRLSESAFYPTSGGQPHDTGSLNGTAVVDVQVGADGAVLHLLAGPLPEETSSVNGQISWPRRYDHMQQHSGQHLLSQVFYRELGLETVSVHFGDALNTVDLDGPLLSAAQMGTVETAANEMVWQNRRIRAYWVSEDERAKVPLRRAPAVQGSTRIVEIDKFDWSACGGTHVRRTGEIGLVSLVRIEKHRGRSRVHFVCGRRALEDAGMRRGLLAETAGLLDSGVQDVPELVAKLQEALRSTERELKVQQEALVEYQAREMLARAETAAGVRLVAREMASSEPALVQKMARALIAEPGVVALLGCAQRGKGTVVFARSQDLFSTRRQSLAGYAEAVWRRGRRPAGFCAGRRGGGGEAGRSAGSGGGVCAASRRQLMVVQIETPFSTLRIALMKASRLRFTLRTQAIRRNALVGVAGNSGIDRAGQPRDRKTLE